MVNIISFIKDYLVDLHYENKALFVVAEVRNDGLREILRVRLADSEDSFFW